MTQLITISGWANASIIIIRETRLVCVNLLPYVKEQPVSLRALLHPVIISFYWHWKPVSYILSLPFPHCSFLVSDQAPVLPQSHSWLMRGGEDRTQRKCPHHIIKPIKDHPAGTDNHCIWGREKAGGAHHSGWRRAAELLQQPTVWMYETRVPPKPGPEKSRQNSMWALLPRTDEHHTPEMS